MYKWLNEQSMNVRKKTWAALLVLALTLLSVTAVPVTAADVGDNWTQVLSYSTVNDSGSNYFVVQQNATITLNLPSRTYGVWVDMLVNTSDMPITSAISYWNTSATSLWVEEVSDGLYRVFGRLSNHTYTQLTFRFTCAGTGYYELLSCRIMGLNTEYYEAECEMVFGWPGDEVIIYPGDEVDVAGDYDMSNVNVQNWYGVIEVPDWHLYDKITVWGTVAMANIGSVRATIGQQAVDVSVNYIDQSDGTVITRNPSYDVGMDGMYYYAITVDVSELVRNKDENLKINFGGEYNSAMGMIMSFWSCYGQVVVADTAEVSWWQKFTSFMTGLFGGDTSESEQFQDSMESQATEFEDLNDQIQEVTKPSVDDVVDNVDALLPTQLSTDVSNVFGQLFENNVIGVVLLMSIAFGLVGYILYGKKG